jgi:hypothetical protein
VGKFDWRRGHLQPLRGFGLFTRPTTESFDMSGRTVLFVIGMMRSGTSALTRVLSLCGCHLPAVLLGATDRNPRGEWEPVESLKMNDWFLIKNGTTAFDPMFGDTVPGCAQSRRPELLQRARRFLADCAPGAEIVLIKDLRITWLLDVWAEAAAAESFAVRVVIALREPQEVVASMQSFGHHPVLMYALWLKYNLLAERNSRDYSRVFIEYPNLLSDWRTQMRRAADALHVPLQLQNEEAIDAFLTRDLHRHRSAGPREEVFGVPWISRVYSSLSGLAADAAATPAELDEIYRARVACEQTFKTSSVEYGKYPPGIFFHDTLRQQHWQAGRDF